MMRRCLPSALLLVLALSLAPQALVCGTVQKHECSCCGDGAACTCCTIAPLYPEQAAAATATAHITVPDAWAPLTDLHPAPVASVPAARPHVKTVHGPPLLLQTSRLRI